MLTSSKGGIVSFKKEEAPGSTWYKLMSPKFYLFEINLKALFLKLAQFNEQNKLEYNHEVT